MNEVYIVAIGGAAVGYLTGEMNLRSGMNGALMGAVIGLGIGYVYKSITDSTNQLAAAQQQAIQASPRPAALYQQGYIL